MKFLLSILFTTLLSLSAFGQYESIKLKDSPKLMEMKSLSSNPSCIFAKDIKQHYCTPRVSQFVSPDPVFSSGITLGINPTGYIPGTSCSNAGSHKDWTHFNIKTEVIFFHCNHPTPYIVHGSAKTQNNIPMSSLYSLSGSSDKFYNMPSNLTGGIPNCSSGNSYKIRVTITGVNGTTVSNYSTSYIMNVTKNVANACTSILNKGGYQKM